MSLYSMEYVSIFANPKFLDAYRLIPYFAFGTFFLALTDYTTLQYHLANKTYIDFTIKLISGIIGVLLNIFLIPKFGLIGVGIATLCANFLYFLLSIIIVLPNLRLGFPILAARRMCIAFVPFAICYLGFTKIDLINPIVEMGLLMYIFYAFYWFSRKFIKTI